MSSMVEGSNISISKAVKGATKPKEAPPKDKYIYAIRAFVSSNPHPEVPYAQLSRLLVPKLNSPSLIVSLKAHLVFHQLISDANAPKYIFLTYISKHYATANRSSVDCTTFDIINDFRNFNRQQALPNLAHAIPQSIDTNRLVSAYNRYLRERILHFKFLKMDPIREKIDGNSLVDTTQRHKLHLPESSADLLNQIQCSIQQIRLILACIFTPASLNHPLYSYCYGLVSMDLSILFRFINLALVAALQNFFSLPRECSERTLFAYKEYTQLQLAEEVHTFINMGPNAVSPKDLEIPGPLRQDEQAVKQLTKSLEDFLYASKDKENRASSSTQNNHSRMTKSDSSSSLSSSTSSDFSSSSLNSMNSMSSENLHQRDGLSSGHTSAGSARFNPYANPQNKPVAPSVISKDEYLRLSVATNRTSSSNSNISHQKVNLNTANGKSSTKHEITNSPVVEDRRMEIPNKSFLRKTQSSNNLRSQSPSTNHDSQSLRSNLSQMSTVSKNNNINSNNNNNNNNNPYMNPQNLKFTGSESTIKPRTVSTASSTYSDSPEAPTPKAHSIQKHFDTPKSNEYLSGNPSIPVLSTAALSGDLPETKPLSSIKKNGFLSNVPPSAPPTSALPMPPLVPGGRTLSAKSSASSLKIAKDSVPPNPVESPSSSTFSPSPDRRNSNSKSSYQNVDYSSLPLPPPPPPSSHQPNRSGSVSSIKSSRAPSVHQHQQQQRTLSKSKSAANLKYHNSNVKNHHHYEDSSFNKNSHSSASRTPSKAGFVSSNSTHKSSSTNNTTQSAQTRSTGNTSSSTNGGTKSSRDDSKDVTDPSTLPEGFDPNDPSMENWQKLLDTLDHPEATFSLKFDLASALQRSIAFNEKAGKLLSNQDIPPVPDMPANTHELTATNTNATTNTTTNASIKKSNSGHGFSSKLKAVGENIKHPKNHYYNNNHGSSLSSSNHDETQQLSKEQQQTTTVTIPRSQSQENYEKYNNEYRKNLMQSAISSSSSPPSQEYSNNNSIINHSTNSSISSSSNQQKHHYPENYSTSSNNTKTKKKAPGFLIKSFRKVAT